MLLDGCMLGLAGPLDQTLLVPATVWLLIGCAAAWALGGASDLWKSLDK